MSNSCRQQFRTQCFFFHCEDDEKDSFSTTQWSKRRVVYVAYRFVVWIYVFGWWLAYYIYYGINDPTALKYTYRYLTLWGRWFETVYFCLALALSIVGYCRRHTHFSEPVTVKWLRNVTWVVHSIAQTAAIAITVLYWTALAPESDGNLADPFNIDTHAMNSVVFLIEIFVVASPVRLLHFVYPMLLAAAYLIATLIFHAVGDTSAVYPILDWENDPGLAAGIGVGLLIVGVPVIHSFFFGLFCLRSMLSKKCCNMDASYELSFPGNSMGADNPVFVLS